MKKRGICVQEVIFYCGKKKSLYGATSEVGNKGANCNSLFVSQKPIFVVAIMAPHSIKTL
jgi:hypothetical protein